jgi:branched-chain amino acid transport system ATP-binding protein
MFTFAGRDISALDTKQRVDAGLCLVPEKRELFAAMSVGDNLLLGAYSRRRDGARAIAATMDEVFARFPRLGERRRQLAGSLSGGERQMLALGRALMGRPKLLMLDEPSLGLAPRIVKDILVIVEDLRHSGVAILLVEQNARAALHVADVGYVLELGKVTLSGESSALASDPRVVEVYLGASRDKASA